MKQNLTFAMLILILAAFGTDGVWAQDDVLENKHAPANYDANLRAGSKAIGAANGDFEVVNIVSKSGGVYRTTRDDGTDNFYLYRANSVYSYFDVQKWSEIIDGKEDLITPFLQCYAQKHNADFERVKGNGFREPYYADASEMKNSLENSQAKLAELEAHLKTLAARPDTFLAYDKNPAVWHDIAANRAEYLPCAMGGRRRQDIADSPQLRAHRDGIAKVLKAVNEYDPKTMRGMYSDSEYAFYAVSMQMRNEWLTKTNALDFKDEIDRMLKPLADALAEKLPTHFPRMQNYAVRNAGEEAMIKQVLPSPASSKIFQIGFKQSGWMIDANALGIPRARFKNGVIYRRSTQADHPYCYATYVNIVQTYSGGGTYAASRPVLTSEELVGCPAGAK